MYSKYLHGRDWLGVDINSGLSAQQSAGRDAQTAARPTAARYTIRGVSNVWNSEF